MMKLGFRVAGCVGEMFLHLCISIFFFRLQLRLLLFLYLLDDCRKYKPLLMISLISLAGGRRLRKL